MGKGSQLVFFWEYRTTRLNTCLGEIMIQRKPLKKVKHRLLDEDMNVGDLAKEMNLSYTLTSAILNGIHIPSEKHMKKIAEALNSTIEELFAD